MRLRWGIFSTYPCKGINIIPHASLVMIVNSLTLPMKESSLLEVVILGQVFHLELPFKLKRGYSTGARGPQWSRNKRVWVYPRK